MRERERGRRERGGRASEIREWRVESGEWRVESREEWIREWGVTERRLEGGMSTAAAVQCSTVCCL